MQYFLRNFVLLAVTTLWAPLVALGSDETTRQESVGIYSLEWSHFGKDEYDNQDGPLEVRLDCGATKTASLPSRWLRVTVTNVSDESECLWKAHNRCFNEINESWQKMMIRAVCDGCHCPECGAASCQPFSTPPDEATIIETTHGTTIANGQVVSCRVECAAPRVEYQYGCSNCAKGHIEGHPQGAIPSMNLEDVEISLVEECRG